MFVRCAQTAEDIDTIFIAYNSPVSLPDRVKIWLTSVNPSSPHFPQSDPIHVDFSVGEIRWQIATE